MGKISLVVIFTLVLIFGCRYRNTGCFGPGPTNSKSSVSSGVNVEQSEKSDSIVSFIAIFHINEVTKDGYNVNGYIVTIDDKQAQKINGKKIKITGVVTVVKGLDNKPEEYDKEGNKIVMQGRNQDTSHILRPSIEVIE